MKFTIYNLQFTIKLIALVFTLYIVHFTFLTPAYASTLSLSPATGTFNRSCAFSLDILLDTQGAVTDGTDAILNFDASKFTANTIDTQGKVYPDYPGNSIDNSSGKIMISGLAAPTVGFSGSGKLATVTFAVKDSASTGATQMTFDFDPNDKSKTTDSNVVQKGTAEETLSSVVNGSYIVGAGTCGSATPAPGLIGGGQVGGATPSATFIPFKTLPDGGTYETTATIAIIGSVLTILGILGLVLL